LKVLKLSAQGLPQSWISLEQAVLHYAADQVRWEAGAEVAVFRGGINADSGRQSIIAVNSIIGTKGVPNINPFELKPGLTNGKLFARDRNVCAYCADEFHEDELTREHIVPFAQNGRDHWMNVVTACRACNHRKGSRTPEQAGMSLIYAPYVPSLWEDFILRNRRILADQMEFLMAHLPKNSRLHDA
jgi:hypothetical protein